jgi:hypothetical protein
MQGEFYAVAFQKKLYINLDEMHQDLDEWMKYYNQNRAHSGRFCYGKMPMESFKEDDRTICCSAAFADISEGYNYGILFL